jgi:hypothetical protein
MEADRYTHTYRAHQVHQIMNWIRAGQSGSLVGLRGAGKSNLVHFLLRQDVKQHYLGQDNVHFVFVLVNLLSLAQPDEWVVYELILSRLLDRLRKQRTENDTLQKVAPLYDQITQTRDPLAAQRVIERGIDILCRHPKQLVLIFDEFDSVFQTLPSALFRCLRAIRDMHKDQVSYIVVTTNDLAHLRDDLTQVEHFYRMVSRNVCTLGPYDQTDAQQMILYLASRRSMKPSAKATEHLITLSGGHAGLLKVTLNLLWDARQEGRLSEWATTLPDDQAVQAECRKLWDGLLEDEQSALRALANRARAEPQALCQLRRRGLVREASSGVSIFSPLFAEYIRRQSPPLQGLIIRRSPRIAQINGRCIENLTELEFEMLCYLYEHRGHVCTKDELIKNVYRQRYNRMAGGVTDESLHTLIYRIRNKVEPQRKRSRYIVTIRGEGYKLVKQSEIVADVLPKAL